MCCEPRLRRYKYYAAELRKINPHLKWGLVTRFEIFPIYIVDGDEKKHGSMLMGTPVYSVEALNAENKDTTCILVCSIYYESIKRTLKEMGWTEFMNFIPRSHFNTEELIWKVLSSERKWEWKCKKALETMRLGSTGALNPCCEMYQSAGNLLAQDYDEIESSVSNKCLRLSILNGSYCFCDQELCPLLRHNKKVSTCDDRRQRMMPDDVQISVMEASYDENCNLHCVSCRKNVFWEESTKLEVLTSKFIHQMLPKAKKLFLSGAGEVFVSPYCQEILSSEALKNVNRLRIRSNGNVCKKDLWDHITTSVNGNVSVAFSIDAATTETYSNIRRGGSFQKIEKHLEYLLYLRENGQITDIEISFVMQRENYLEMVPFVEFGLRHNVDVVNFTHIRNWGTYPETEFRDICMYEIVGGKIIPDRELQEQIERVKSYGSLVQVDEAV